MEEENKGVYHPNKVKRTLNGFADIIIPPQKRTVSQPKAEKLAKLLYGKTILSDDDRGAIEDLIRYNPIPDDLRS